VLRETARESLPISFSSLFLVVNLQGAVLFLGLFASDTTLAGEYLASQRIVLTVFGFTLLLTGATFPAAARIVHFARDRVTKLQDQVIRINLLVLMPLVMLGVYYADDIIRLLYGDSFAAAAPVLELMLWAVPLIIIARGFRQTLAAGAIIRPQLIGTAFSAAVHFALAWWLIPEWGLRGAAVANISAYVVLALAMFAFVYREFESFPLTWRMLGPFLATGAGLLALADGVGLSS
jgi:O-antigen/teichoic acid export membrane protein